MMRSLPCLQGVGCKRSDPREPNNATLIFLGKFSRTLKPKRPQPWP